MLRGRGGEERGTVAITVVLAMTVLLGFAALVVDIGLNWAARTSAQTAADAAALAGASTLVSDGGAAAVLAVVDYLDENVDGLADPSNLAWVDNDDESDGEIVCWTVPGSPPGPGAGCPDGSNALQVTTPPVQVQYAFAPVLGQASNSIKARAAAAAGPAAPNNCVLCLLEPSLVDALALTSNGGVEVSGGGIVVNSSGDPAVVLTGGGDVRANQIRILGTVDDSPGGQFIPAPEFGGPPVPDPLADLPTADALTTPPCCALPAPPQVVTSDTTLDPGVYRSITVAGNATLTLQAGVYVLTDPPGLSVTGNGRVAGDGVTVYLACSGYPAPCAGPGAPLTLALNGHYLASPPTSGEYAGLAFFSDRGNTAPLVIANNTGLNLDGALYAASAPLTISSSPGLQVDGLLVTATMLLDGNGPVHVDYDPSVLLPGVGPPVLIR